MYDINKARENVKAFKEEEEKRKLSQQKYFLGEISKRIEDASKGGRSEIMVGSMAAIFSKSEFIKVMEQAGYIVKENDYLGNFFINWAVSND